MRDGINPKFRSDDACSPKPIAPYFIHTIGALTTLAAPVEVMIEG